MAAVRILKYIMTYIIKMSRKQIYSPVPPRTKTNLTSYNCNKKKKITYFLEATGVREKLLPDVF